MPGSQPVTAVTYALVLPALTLESIADCGIEEHEHTDGCYESVLICGQEESEGHHHSEACYDESGALICGQEEFEGHRATLFLNWSAPLIRRLASLEDAEKVRICLQILYVQSLLTGRFPLQGGEMALLNEDLIRLIEWGVS